MAASHLTTIARCDDPGTVSGTSPGCLRKLYRDTRNRLQHLWLMGWLNRSGQGAVGRLAARVASWGTMPYHGRAYLADLTPRGFIAPSAAISHPDLRLGEHVYIGDSVVVSFCEGGGPLELRDRVQVYGDAFLNTGSGGSIHIGKGTHIQPGCHMHAFLAEIRIGENVEIAPGCGFYCYDHGIVLGRTIMEQPLATKGGISVGDGAWLGHRVTVLQGVSIGAGAVIAAGAVVVHSIPDNAIAAGVPARVIRYRTAASDLSPEHLPGNTPKNELTRNSST